MGLYVTMRKWEECQLILCRSDCYLLIHDVYHFKSQQTSNRQHLVS